MSSDGGGGSGSMVAEGVLEEAGVNEVYMLKYNH